MCLSVHPHYCNVPLRDRQALFSLRCPHCLSQRTHRRESGIKLVFCQGRSMLADLKLRARILQRLIHVFEDLFGILAIVAIGRKIRRDELGFSSATGIDNVRFPMFDSYAVSHSLVSSTVRVHVPGQTRHTVRCTVSEVGCQIKTSAFLTTTAAAIVFWAHVMLSSRAPFDFLKVWET